LSLSEWQQRWRPILIQSASTNANGHINGLYCISDAFAEDPHDPQPASSDLAGKKRRTYHVTVGYSTRLAERFSMEYARMWPQRGRIRIHFILPLPGELSRDQMRVIESRIHMHCAVHAREERLRTTEFYRPEALPLIYACFESVVKHYRDIELPLPYRLDAAQRGSSGSFTRCWVYRQPEPHPEVNIFKKQFPNARKAWLEYRRAEIDLMKPFRVSTAARVGANLPLATRATALQSRPKAPLGGNGRAT
jgi:hypothetical protein